jgi:hypothetical protein
MKPLAVRAARSHGVHTQFTLDTYGHLLPQRGRDVAPGFDRLVRQRCDAGTDKAGKRRRAPERAA